MTRKKIYIIQESRINKLLDDFFWDKIKGAKAFPLEFGYIHYIKNQNVLFEVEKVPKDHELGMSKILYNQIRNIFSLSENETKNYIIEKMENMLNKKFTDIYLFDV